MHNTATSIILCALLGACADTSCSLGASSTAPCDADMVAALQAESSGTEPWRNAQIHIDRTFSSYERAKILRAVNEWNEALNRNMRLEISNRDYDASSTGVAGLGGDDWTIVKVDSRDPKMGPVPKNHALAMTAGTRPAIIMVLADRVGPRDLSGIMLHEFGHALGAGHESGGGLMNPHYGAELQRCVDKEAARAVAKANHLSLANLNWCNDPTEVAQVK